MRCSRPLPTRPYLWSTHVWNMFDFAADARDEGGCKGRNNKGLVTYDRKIKKDAFYIYQAYWTTAPMVHVCRPPLCGPRPRRAQRLLSTPTSRKSRCCSTASPSGPK